MKIEFFKTDDHVTLGYMDKGSGIPVILMAGYSAPVTSWYREEKTLLKYGYRVIAFDRRSHGSSENPSFGQDMATQGRDIDALMRHLKIKKAFLIGQSQGASAMWAYISQFGTEHLYGVISIDQTPKMINEEGWPYGIDRFRSGNTSGIFRCAPSKGEQEIFEQVPDRPAAAWEEIFELRS